MILYTIFIVKKISTNSKIQFFVNLLNIKDQISELEQQLSYKEFCIICKQNVSKLYKNKNGLMTCNNC